MVDSDRVMTVILIVFALIVGLTIVDSIAKDATNLLTTANESVGTANASGYKAGNLAQDWVSNTLTYCNNTLQTANVTITGSTGAYVVNGANCAGSSIKIHYDYQPDAYFSSSISRTVISYAVPIGIIGAIVLMAGLSGSLA